jgi:hypothetical protein
MPDYIRRHSRGLKEEVEERLAVSWDAEDPVEQGNALLPEGHAVALRDEGIAQLRWRGSMPG